MTVPPRLLNLSALDDALNEAINAGYNGLGAAHGLQPMAWRMSHTIDATIEGTHPAGRAALGAAELCEQWASLFGLRELDGYGVDDGCRVWSDATPDGNTVELHCINDPELYAKHWPDDPI